MAADISSASPLLAESQTFRRQNPVTPIALVLRLRSPGLSARRFKNRSHCLGVRLCDRCFLRPLGDGRDKELT